MKKVLCKQYIEELSRFLLKSKNSYAQDMSKKLNEYYDNYCICCGNDEIDIQITFRCKKKKGKE